MSTITSSCHFVISTLTTLTAAPFFHTSWSPFYKLSVFKAFSCIQKGTASGPFLDSSNFLTAFACLTTLPISLMTTLLVPLFPSFLLAMFLLTSPLFLSSIYLSSARHKDNTNPDKLHCIGVGTAWRRIIGDLITSHYASDFTTFLQTLAPCFRLWHLPSISPERDCCSDSWLTLLLSVHTMIAEASPKSQLSCTFPWLPCSSSLTWHN